MRITAGFDMAHSEMQDTDRMDVVHTKLLCEFKLNYGGNINLDYAPRALLDRQHRAELLGARRE